MNTTPRQKNSVINWLVFIALAISCSVAGRWLGYLMARQDAKSADLIPGDVSRKQVLAALKSESEQINKTTPIAVDKSTQLDTTYIEGDSLVYSFSTPQTSSKDINIAKFTSAMRQSLINGYKTNPDLQSERDCNISLVYKYRDKDGIYFSTISISPKDF